MKLAGMIWPVAVGILSIAFMSGGEDGRIHRDQHQRLNRVGVSPSDLQEVESIVRDYIEGWYMGDVERMDRALHDDLVKRMPVREGAPASGGFHPVSKARMLELTAEGGGENPDAVFDIVIDDVSTNIAAARVASPEYLDYLHLAKTESGWKIVNVLFRTRASD